ncbi:MAG: hypothetical protein U0229_09280 [Anaeromyxobacter sp.]
MDLAAFYEELRRRRVVRVLLAYGVVAFGALQVAEPILHALGLGEGPMRLVVFGLAAGFPAAAVLSWIYDLTPRGLERTAPVVRALPVVNVPSVAVLPFADLSPGGDHGWFCDGVAEEMLSALCCVPGLRVVSRSSSFQFRGKDVDARQVGQALGATTLLEGSVRRAGGRVRVAARIVDARAGVDLWSESFDRALEDTFAVQEEIALAVVRALRLRVGGDDEGRLRASGASRATKDPRAYDLYLRARHALMGHSPAGLAEARDAAKAALALDPGFAHAHAALADVAVMAATWNFTVPGAGDLRGEALAAAAEALRLAPELAEARLAHANVLTLLGRADEAEADFRRAEALAPGWADAPYFHGRALHAMGRTREAVAAFEEAVRRDPDDFAALAMLENALQNAGDLEAARRASVAGLAAAERRLAIAPDDVRALYFGAALDWQVGGRKRAAAWAERALALGGDDFTVLYNVACYFARAGDRSRALDLLERAAAKGEGSRAWITHDPDVASLRDEPRFQAILARLKA